MPTPQVPLTAPQSRLSTPDVTPLSLSLSPDLPRTAPHISLINAAAYVCACKLEGSVQFSLQLCPEDVKLCAASTESTPPPDLSSVPTDYHEFADVFSKAKATELPLHRDFDLKIDLEEGASPPLSTIYSLLPSELESLRTFIDEHISYAFI